MPGFLQRKHFDQSTWTRSDWKAAWQWNCLFLLGWIVAFTLAIVLNLRSRNVVMTIGLAGIGLTGVLIQVANLTAMSKTVVQRRKGE